LLLEKDTRRDWIIAWAAVRPRPDGSPGMGK
jgi:hypothetical protein